VGVRGRGAHRQWLLGRAPLVRGRKGEYRRELADLRKQGFVRARVDGEIVELESDIKLTRNVNHDIDAVVDRLVVKPGIEKRLLASLEVALRLAPDDRKSRAVSVPDSA